MELARSPARLSLPLQRLREDLFEPEFVAEAPLVRFVAYADARRVFGWLRLRADRLTDLLNACEEVLLFDAEIEDLVEGTTGTADAVLLARSELVAVHANGPRGDEARRLRTRTHPLVVQSGSFLIAGHLHAPTGIDPLVNVHERPPMIPLTDGWIEFWSGGGRRRQWTGILVVNRDLAQVIRTVTEEELAEGLVNRLDIGRTAATT
jgi:hypothetical protein